MSQQVHCHRCKQWLGESSRVLELVGLFKDPRQRERVAEPRDTWRCRACGWANVFLPAGRIAVETSPGAYVERPGSMLPGTEVKG